jgi:amino acid transporter
MRILEAKMIRTLQFLAVLLTSIAMAAGWAHLLALPNKMALSREDYLVAQQVYRGWAMLGIVVIAALAMTAVLTLLLRESGRARRFSLGAALCIGISLAVFFLFTFPANQATGNWTTLPQQWEALRRQWEYSHAFGAVLYFVALGSLTLSIMYTGSPDQPGDA